MREIEFRAKTTSEVWGGNQVKDGTWVYGFYRDKVGLPVISQFEIDRGDYIDYEIIETTIGQYTGLKDKNGKKIFEGDIIEFNKGRNLPNYTVIPELIRWNERDCAFQRYPLGKSLTTGGAGKLIQSDMMSECEVIGNIYDNPELLKGE